MFLCFLAIMMRLLIAYLMTLQHVQFHLKNMETQKLLRWDRAQLCKIKKLCKLYKAVQKNNQTNSSNFWIFWALYQGGGWGEGWGCGYEPEIQTGCYKIQWNPTFSNLQKYLLILQYPIANDMSWKATFRNLNLTGIEDPHEKQLNIGLMWLPL